MQVPDYNYLSTDTVRPMSEMVGKWLNVQKGQLDIQKTQSEQVAGQLAQQAIDPTTGQFDPAKFNALLAKTPGAAFAAFPSMKDTSVLRGQNVDQNIKINGYVNDAVTAALASDDDHLRQAVIEQAGRLRGILPPDQVDHALLGLRGDNPAELRKQLETVRVGTLPPQQKQDWTHGTQATITTPQATYITPVPPLRSGQGVTTPHGPAPGTTTTISVPVDGQGIIPTDANGNPTRTPTGYRDMPVHTGTVPGVPQGGPPQITPGPGSTNAAPGLPPGAPPNPAGTRLVNGRFPQPAAPAPNAATPPPAAAPPATTPPAATPPASAAKPPVFTSPPQGQVAEQEASQKQFIADRTALPQRQTQEQNLRHAYDALKLVTTGKGTENASALRNLLVTAGIAGASTANDEAIYEIGRKYTERTIADAGNAGGTDTARAVAAASNPNVSLINPANLAFLRNDIGKVRQQMAAYMTAPDTAIGAGYGKHAADTASNTDYRGFNWDDYSNPEQKEIMKSVGAEGTKAHDALARAIGMGRALWPQKGAGPIVPHAQAAPMMPPPNMLAMAQPQQNALQPA